MKSTLRSKALLLLLTVYTGALLYGTLQPFRFTWHPGRDRMTERSHVEWIPFTHICRIHGILCPYDTGLNIAMFIPVGVLVALMSAPGTGAMRRVARAAGFSFTLSLLIETTQYFIPARFPGTTDIVLNTLGACLGGLAIAGLVRLLNGRTRHSVRATTRPQSV